MLPLAGPNQQQHFPSVIRTDLGNCREAGICKRSKCLQEYFGPQEQYCNVRTVSFLFKRISMSPEMLQLLMNRVAESDKLLDMACCFDQAPSSPYPSPAMTSISFLWPIHEKPTVNS